MFTAHDKQITHMPFWNEAVILNFHSNIKNDFSTSCEIALEWMPSDFIDDE